MYLDIENYKLVYNYFLIHVIIHFMETNIVFVGTIIVL